ncbi:MAG: transglutaminase-like domain-containing protein [Gemmatimonadota bacterium]
MNTMPARERFAALVAGGTTSLDLALAALLVAAEEYPQLVPEPYLQRLDVLAERVKDRLGDETAPPVVLGEISKVLFEEEGFRGNSDVYYDPRNSFLNDVLDRKLGIPLTLGIVYLEIAWRLGLRMHGVNFPGHFLLRHEGEAFRLLVDPFNGGQIRFEDQAQDLLDRVYGGSVKLQPDYLRTASKYDVLVRLLANLKTIYLNAQDDNKALTAIERILLIRPHAAEEVRDRGMVLARTGQVDQAIQALTRYLEIDPGAADAGRVKLLLDQLTRD